jgi:hypothetical protein
MQRTILEFLKAAKTYGTRTSSGWKAANKVE